MSTIIQKYETTRIIFFFPPATTFLYGWTVHQCSFHAIIIALFIFSFAIFKKICNTARYEKFAAICISRRVVSYDVTVLPRKYNILRLLSLPELERTDISVALELTVSFHRLSLPLNEAGI